MMRKNVKNRLVTAAKIVVSVGILALLVARILPQDQEIEQISRTLRTLSPASVTLWILGAFAINATAMTFTVIRWRYLLRGQGLSLGIWDAIGSFLIGRFVGSVTPGTSGLDGWRFYDVGRHARDFVASGAVIVVEKIIGFFVLSVLLVATLPLGFKFFTHNPEVVGEHRRYVEFFLLAAGIPLTASIALLLKPAWIGSVAGRLLSRSSRLGRIVFRVVDAVTAYEKHRSDLLKAVACGFPVHISICSMYFFTSHALGVPVSYSEIMFVAPIMIAATVVPVSIAGIGVRELTFVAFLGPLYGTGLVALFAFMGYLVGQTISLAGGPVWLARRATYRMFRDARARNASTARDEKPGSDDEEGGDRRAA